MSSPARPPAKSPCGVCPYRADTPSGVWSFEDYEKLRAFDLPTQEQPTKVFLCHLNDYNSPDRQVCAGWAGCHDTQNLYALRMAIPNGTLDPAGLVATLNYTTSVRLFASGNDAADHGQADMLAPSTAAVRAINKMVRIRGDVKSS